MRCCLRCTGVWSKPQTHPHAPKKGSGQQKKWSRVFKSEQNDYHVIVNRRFVLYTLVQFGLDLHSQMSFPAVFERAVVSF